MTEPIHRNRSGMTLVEILIAVSIIGLLAAFIIPAYNLAIRHRENALVASRLRQAATALDHLSIFNRRRCWLGLV
jgi:prepilin-type N-terminal cleavage/methylation domain-containing protein